MTDQNWDAWNYRTMDDSAQNPDLTGFSVRATDGDIGKIDEATNEVGASYVVVDTGPWIFGRKVMLPAGTIERVDVDDRTVHVDRTKDQIKDSPELTDRGYEDEDYRQGLGDYYGGTYGRGM
ncbi:PRC-barrel domain-containing protein [Knoellia sp. CPCC 206453]|uniref:PRC-barrel domain-containing protein n=1 Tax=Knoellia pratensis TaxID=3404796 RepID=UPI00361FCD2B